ncbi:hypothetical protein [Roseococcus suduntuyensis]|uniref:Uncharacterized protein n=1 Tax=Roseococcus suduntuyensis TaxID=455361 RepID=A0A840AAI2_9PROT|nr:hypothetical protein [Roseococcus suduntuyensis]MBB3897523.1 hypothetical protein [Roseococcus suduntuyensis]
MTVNIRTLAAGAALLLAPAFAAPALAADSVVVSPQFGTPAYSSDNRNVVGGGEARLVGSGESQRVVHIGPTQAQEPVFAHMVGTGEDARIIYSATPDRAQALSEAGYLPGTRG